MENFRFEKLPGERKLPSWKLNRRNSDGKFPEKKNFRFYLIAAELPLRRTFEHLNKSGVRFLLPSTRPANEQI